MRIAITGSSSSIGRNLTYRLQEEGHEVIPFGGRTSKYWQLGQEFPSIVDVDILIHLAHDRGLSYFENIAATRKLTKSFLGYKIFLSSISAHSHARSIYGKSKFASESHFLEGSGAVLRAGVVYGPSIDGIYRKILDFSRASPIVPVPFGESTRLFTSHIDDLCSEICAMVEEKPKGIFLAAHPWPTSFRELIQKINLSMLGRPTKYVNISPIFSLLLLHLLSLAHLKSSLIDSLKSLVRGVDLSELSVLQPSKTRFRSFEEDVES